MPKQLFTGLVVLFMISITGCASTSSGGGVTTKAYVADKERIDQNMEGNFGYLSGTPKPVDRSLYKKTRKVYVVEFTKDPGEPETTTPVEATEPTSSYEAKEVEAPEAHGRTIELPSFDEERDASVGRAAQEAAEPSEATGGGSEYTVQKDDTLQKISKKFYNTYAKWPKIYEANKSVITNPNRIKPGIRIVIP